MRDHIPTMRSAILGRKLKGWAAAKGLWASEVSRQLGISPSKVSRLYSGKRGANLADIGGFAVLCDITGPERDKALRLGNSLNDPVWVETYLGKVPENPDMITAGEETAWSVTVFHPWVLPDLVQVADYARTLLISSPVLADRDVESRVTQRLRRQAVLSPENHGDERVEKDRQGSDNSHTGESEQHQQEDQSAEENKPPTQFTFFISEHAFRLPTVAPEVMREQLHHILRIGVQPNIHIRVLPNGRGPWWTECAPFRMFEFDEQATAVCLTNHNAVTVLEDQGAVDGYHELVDALARTALTTEYSRLLVIKLAEEMFQPASSSEQPPPIHPTSQIS